MSKHYRPRANSRSPVYGATRPSGLRHGVRTRPSSPPGIDSDDSEHSVTSNRQAQEELSHTTTPDATVEVEEAHDFSSAARSIVRTIGTAVMVWGTQSCVQNSTITFSQAYAPPGCLSGAGSLSARLLPFAAMYQGPDRDLFEAVAETFVSRFDAWVAGLSIPGLPLFPTFSFFNGPYALPTPSCPVPLYAFTSADTDGLLHISADLISATRSVISETSSAPITPVERQLVQDLSAKIRGLLFSPITLMGEGPVPAFEPKYCPIGPVIGGRICPIPLGEGVGW